MLDAQFHSKRTQPLVIAGPAGLAECYERVMETAFPGSSRIEAGRGVDLLVAEAYCYDKTVKFHLDYATLAQKLPAIQPKRLVLTHMSDDMLSRVASMPCEAAEDGKIIEL